jgi:hypothetical protein
MLASPSTNRSRFEQPRFLLFGLAGGLLAKWATDQQLDCLNVSSCCGSHPIARSTLAFHEFIRIRTHHARSTLVTQSPERRLLTIFDVSLKLTLRHLECAKAGVG